MATEPINQLNLVGNFLEKEFQGDDFPKIPTKKIQFKIVDYCCGISLFKKFSRTSPASMVSDPITNTVSSQHIQIPQNDLTQPHLYVNIVTCSFEDDSCNIDATGERNLLAMSEEAQTTTGPSFRQAEDGNPPTYEELFGDK